MSSKRRFAVLQRVKTVCDQLDFRTSNRLTANSSDTSLLLPLLGIQTTPLKRLSQLLPLSQHPPRLLKRKPLPASLMLLGPLSPLLLHRRLVEPKQCSGRILRDLLLRPRFRDLPQLGVDMTYYASLFPGFAEGGFGTRFVELPAAFGEDPGGGASSGGLDEEDMGLLGVGCYDAGDEAVACFVVAWESPSVVCSYKAASA